MLLMARGFAEPATFLMQAGIDHSVWGRPVDPVNDDDFRGASLRFQLESQLLLHGGKHGRICSISRAFSWSWNTNA